MKKLSLLLLVVAFVLGAGIFAQAQTPAPLIPKLTVEEYKANPDKVYVIMFSAATCGPCQFAKEEFLPELEKKLSLSKYAGKVGVYVVDFVKGFPSGCTEDGCSVGGKQVPIPEEWDFVYALPTFAVFHNGTDYYVKEGYSRKQIEKNSADIVATVDDILFQVLIPPRGCLGADISSLSPYFLPFYF